ncbi:MAG: hypothetical protein ACKPGJ_03865 [Dolichospermum sp.]
MGQWSVVSGQWSVVRGQCRAFSFSEVNCKIIFPKPFSTIQYNGFFLTFD